MTWMTRDTRIVYENPWIQVREDAVSGPHGEGIYGVVRLRNPAVFIVAIDDEERVRLVRVDRYTVGSSWEVPAGGTDGEEPLIAAQRELHEETGLKAENWTEIGAITALNGVAEAPERIFLARGLSAVSDASPTQREEGIDELAWVPFAEAIAMIADGRITDGETVAALALAAIALGRLR